MSLLEKYRSLNPPEKKIRFFKAKFRKSGGNSSTRVSIFVISPSTNLRIGCNFFGRWLRYRATTSKEGKTTNSFVIPSKNSSKLEFENWNFRKGVPLWLLKLNYFFQKFDIIVSNTKDTY